MFRKLAVVVATFALGLTLASDAQAGKKDKGKGKADVPEIEMTGLEAFDSIFTEFKAIDDKIGGAEKSMKVARRKLNEALELEKGTPLKAGMADLAAKAEGKIQMKMNGKQPTLSASDAVPENVNDAINALNKMTKQLTISVEELASVPEDLKRLSAASADFPSSLKDELTKSGAKITDAPKILKTLKGNLTATATLPDRSTKVAAHAGKMVVMVGEVFPSGDDAAPEEGAEGEEAAKE